MKTPESAAGGSEAGHLNTPQRDGTGAVPGREAKGTEAQATRPSAAPCGVPWCRSDAYPGSEWCQFHEVVNPFDDTSTEKP